MSAGAGDTLDPALLPAVVNLTATNEFVAQAAGSGGVWLCTGDASTSGFIRFVGPDNSSYGFIGHVGTSSTSAIALNNDRGGGFIFSGGPASPGSDASQDLGLAYSRWNNIRAATGTIQTSDARDKLWRGPLTAAEMRAAKRIAKLIGVFQWTAAVKVKTAAAARLHTGVRAQDVRDACSAEGLDGTRYGFLCYDSWAAAPAVPEQAAVAEQRDASGAILVQARAYIPGVPARPAGDRWGVRPDELYAFVLAAMTQAIWPDAPVTVPV